MKKKRAFRRLLSALILVISLLLLGWGLWPLRSQAQSLTMQPAEMQMPTPTGEMQTESLLPGQEKAQPGVTEARRLTLEWPTTIRAGDSDVARLTLDVDDRGNLTPTVMIEGHEQRGETVVIPNVYDTHNVLAEARIDLAGMQVSPAEGISQPLLPGEAVSFYWSLSPQQVGAYRGTVWLKLRFLPRSGGEESERTLTAQLIEIEAVNLLGLGGTPARLMGGVGTVVGSVIGWEDLIKWLWGKLRRRRSSRRRR
jgi:hypothetical protein